MLGFNQVIKIAGKNASLSETMIYKIEEWQKMMRGQAEWNSDTVESLMIPSGICREFADAVLNEFESSVDNEKINEIYQKVISDLNEHLQEGLGLGAFCVRPLSETAAEFVSADRFIPIEFADDGSLRDVVFIARKTFGKEDFYTRAERHYLNADGYLTIENKCYHSTTASELGRECSLEAVPEWEQIEAGPLTYVGMEQMDFGYYKNPLINNVDGSKNGVSMFGSAKKLIKKADVQAARLDWEYESGERAIHVDTRALKKSKNGDYTMPKLNKRLYKGLNLEAGDNKELYKEFSPAMRDDAYIRGVEDYLRKIEFNVGLAYGDLSNVNTVEKTAEEIKTSKQRKYNRVNAIQNKLEQCLSDFVDGLAFRNGVYTTKYELTCNFKDNVLSDEKTERAQDMADVAAGLMAPFEYRMKWYNETEEEAKANVPEQNGVME